MKIKVLEETQIYDVLRGNLMKIIILGAISIPVLTNLRETTPTLAVCKRENAHFSALGEGI